MSPDTDNVASRDPDGGKNKLLFIGLPVILTFCVYLGLVLEENYGDMAWFKAIVYADYGEGPYDGRTGMTRTVDNSGVIDSGQSGAASASGVDASQLDPTYQDVIFGEPVTCANINTDRWYPQYFDSNNAEIETASQAIEALTQIGVLDEGEVIVRQGSNIRIVPIGSPELDHLANRTSICVP